VKKAAPKISHSKTNGMRISSVTPTVKKTISSTCFVTGEIFSLIKESISLADTRNGKAQIGSDVNIFFMQNL
jgi:hypothetical protein